MSGPDTAGLNGVEGGGVKEGVDSNKRTIDLSKFAEKWVVGS